jgi:hypothetical protein
MGQILHGSAKTTHAIRGELQRSEASVASLKELRFKTPYEAIEELWKFKPEIFKVKPHHHNLGLNT